MAAKHPGENFSAEPYQPLPADDYQGHLTAPPPPPPRGPLRRLLAGAALTLALGVGMLAVGYLYISREIPAMESVREYHPLVTTKVVASDGTKVGEFYREKRTVVTMDKIPRVLIQAVISAEDKDFYKHPGLNNVAMARAVWCA